MLSNRASKSFQYFFLLKLSSLNFFLIYICIMPFVFFLSLNWMTSCESYLAFQLLAESWISNHNESVIQKPVKVSFPYQWALGVKCGRNPEESGLKIARSMFPQIPVNNAKITYIYIYMHSLIKLLLTIPYFWIHKFAFTIFGLVFKMTEMFHWPLRNKFWTWVRAVHKENTFYRHLCEIK